MIILFCKALMKLEEHLMFYNVSWKHVMKSSFFCFCVSHPFTGQVANVWPTKYGLLFERSSSSHELPPGPPRYPGYSVQNIITWAFLCWFWGEIVSLRVWDDDNFHGNSIDLCHFLSCAALSRVPLLTWYGVTYSLYLLIVKLNKPVPLLKITILCCWLNHLLIVLLWANHESFLGFSFIIRYRNPIIYLLEFMQD